MRSLPGWLVPIALAAALAPLAVVRIPPLCDLPNHLARAHVLAHHAEQPLLEAFYRVAPKVLPNLALDAIVPLLARLVGTDLAGSLFVAAAITATVLGAAAMARASGASAGLAAALAGLLVHNVALAYGFVNYAFGVGWMLCAIAAWLALRGRGPVLRIAVSMPIALGLFFAHLVPLFLYGVAVAAIELDGTLRGGPGRLRRLGRAVAAAAPQFVAPGVLYLLLSPTRGELDRWIPASPLDKLREAATALVVGDGVRDVVFTAAVAAVVVLLVLGARIRLGRGGLLTVLAALGFYAVTPDKSTTVDHISIRIPPAVVLLAVGFLRVEFRSARRRTAVLVALVATLVGRGVQLTTKWSGERADYDAILAAADRIPPGSTLFTLRDRYNRVEIRGAWRPPLAHAACLVLLRTPVLVPQLFANVEQQPIEFRNESFERMREPRGSYIPHYTSPGDFAAWLDAFRALHDARELPAGSVARDAPLFVLLVHDTPLDGLPRAGTMEVAAGRRFALWRVD